MFIPQKQGVMEIFFHLRCDSSSIFFDIFIGGNILYKLILHVIALVLALLIRKVEVDVLNDSRETVIVIYASTILLVTISLVIVVLRPPFEILSLAYSIIIFLITTTYLGLTFITKVLYYTSICMVS